MNSIDKNMIRDYVANHINSPIPQDIMSIVNYKLIEYSTIFMLSLLGIMICIRIGYNIYTSDAKWKYSYDGSMSEEQFLSYLGLIALVGVLVVVGIQGFDFVKILISPKYFLTDYISSI